MLKLFCEQAETVVEFDFVVFSTMAAEEAKYKYN